MRTTVNGGVTALAAALVLAAPVKAQIPDTFENLQVLPKDIARNELTAVMRGFSFATGYRCSNCHVGEEGQPFSTYDFASDDKALKRKARQMLKMVQAINGEYLSALPERREPNVAVTCSTCHGGVARPEPIESLLERTALEDGADAAQARYKELRERYFGGRAYDFGVRPLLETGTSLARGDHVPEAMAVMDLALEFYPDSPQAWFATGQLREAAGDTEGALAAYRKTLELDPQNRGAQRRLEALGGGA